VPYELVRNGSRWRAFEVALADWITNVAPHLPEGAHEFYLPVTPLRFAVAKSSGSPPVVFLRPPEPADDTLSARVGKQIRRKLALCKAER
jgi:hypothetical protein